MPHRRTWPVSFVLALSCAWCGVSLGEEDVEARLGVGSAGEPSSQPAPDQTVVVTLDTGETLRGVLLTQNDVRARLLHPALGQIDIPNQRIRRIARVQADRTGTQPQATPREEIEEAQEEAAEAAERSPSDSGPTLKPEPGTAKPGAGVGPEPEESKPEVKWSGSLEFGLSGSKGNTDRISTRTRAAVRRQSMDEVFTASLRHRYTRDRDRDTENELYGRARQEWLIPGSPWSLFVEGDGELNRFREYNVLATALGGVGYEFLNTPDTLLIGRVSAGAGYQDTGRSEGVRPRARAGVEFRHNIAKGVTFTSSGEITPELDALGEFRSRVAGAFDIALNEDKSLRLRVGAEDRFDTAPGARESHDIDYFVTLVYGF